MFPECSGGYMNLYTLKLTEPPKSVLLYDNFFDKFLKLSIKQVKILAFCKTVLTQQMDA